MQGKNFDLHVNLAKYLKLKYPLIGKMLIYGSRKSKGQKGSMNKVIEAMERVIKSKDSLISSKEAEVQRLISSKEAEVQRLISSYENTIFSKVKN